MIYSEDKLAEILQNIYPSNIYIDLRDREDYETGHINGFINIPTLSGEEVDTYLQRKELQNKTIFLMCYTGKRSAFTFDLLQNKGYKRIVYITFGYDDYVKSQEDFIPEKGECDCLAE